MQRVSPNPYPYPYPNPNPNPNPNEELVPRAHAATIKRPGQPKYHKGFYPLVPGFDYVTYNDVDELRTKVKDARGGLLGKGKSRARRHHARAAAGRGRDHAGDARVLRRRAAAVRRDGRAAHLRRGADGHGPHGKMWGYQQLEVEPDVFTTAKARWGGVPIGAMLCKLTQP